MTAIIFADISTFQGTAINWSAYKAWAASFDGVARIAIKATEGVGFTDPTFAAHRAGALAAGISCILYYHFSRPDLGNSGAAEADYLHSVVGAVRSSDTLMLDFEVNDPRATAAWAYAWLARQEANYGGKLPGIYASTSYIQQHLQAPQLSRYPLWLADWHFNPDARPACPRPWTTYTWLQYTDRAVMPGISGIVDGNIYTGEHTPVAKTTIPHNWSDDGTTLKAPNGHTVREGMRDYILKHSWDADNWPVEDEQKGLSPLEQSNPGLGTGNQQVFNTCVLEFTSTRGVFMAYVGPELLFLRKKIADLQAQIAKIQGKK